MAGYNEPQKARDNWTSRLYAKYGLGEAPTMEQIEPVALKLLGNVGTSQEGAELVLGRRVDARETSLAMAYLMGGDPEHKFALLLLAKSTED